LATVRILRSTTAGNVPSSLVSGQIAINEGDGKLFYRAANGTVTLLPTGGGSSLAAYETTAGFPATGSSGVLYLSTDASRVYQWTGSAYVEVGVSGGGAQTTIASGTALPTGGSSGDIYLRHS
jgi:hypothetical protein